MQELSRDALEAIVGSIPAGVVVIEKEKGRTIYVNERALQLFGVDPLGLELPEHSTKLIKLLTLNGDVYPPEQLPASVALLTGKEAQAEVVIERQDGSRVITAGSSKPIRDEKGEVIAAVAIFEDITGRKQGEEALRVSEEKFSKAFEGSPFAVTLTRLSDGAIVEVNDAGLKLFGFDRSEIIGKTSLELRTWANTNDRTVLAKELSAKGSFQNQETTLLKKDGTHFDVVMSGAIISINAEKYWIASFIDITERKKAEEALRQSEEKYRQIVTTAQEGILILDQQGKITYLNQVLTDWIGYSIEEVIGEFVFKFIAKEDLEKTYERWEKRRVDVVESYDLRLRRKDGVDIWLIVNGTSLKDKDGNFVGLLAMIANITERKRVELACKMSEERFRDLVESTSDWIWQVDQNAVYTYVSPKVKDILGYEPQEVLGKTPFDLMPEQTAEDIGKAFGDITKNKKGFYGLENWNIHKNGKLVLLETSGVPILDQDGNLAGYRGIDRDVTERKKAEEALKESEQLYRILFDNSDDGFMLLEPIFDENGRACDFRFLKLNSAYERQTGAKADEVLGRKASEVTPDLEPEIAAISGEVAKTGKSIHNEAYNKYSNKWYDSYYFPYTKGHVGILFREITERKKAEEALMESEERFQSLFEQSPTAFEIYDKNGLQIQTNHAWEKMWNVPREYCNGKFNIFESKQIAEMGLLPYVKKAYAGETVLVPETPFDASLEPQTLGEGRKRWLRSIYYPIINVHGDVINLVVMHEDVTEKKNLEKQLQDSERMAAIGQTAGMIGHDIRNPLQAIISELYLVKEDIAQAPDGKHKQESLDSVNFVEEQVNYINKIVSDLQDYARPLNPEFTIVNLADLIVSVFDTIILPDMIKLSVDVKDNLKFKSDPTFVKRSITNLVNNAVQAMPDGGELGLSAQRKEDCIVICVSDTGQGIPEHVKNNLFKPLTTTKSKGQGLGLAVVKRLIEALNGKVSFESEEGKGTKFIIELPA